jgi:DNA (cytosine-5)-methyltransferase 1
MTKIYINEIDDFACHWLEQLMKDEIIPNAHIDNRSIKDVKSNELQGYDQCHFFGGIGVWLYGVYRPRKALARRSIHRLGKE